MAKRIAAVVFIYLCNCMAWGVLGTSTQVRTDQQDSKLRGAVSRLWGTGQRQAPPTLHYVTETKFKQVRLEGKKKITEWFTNTEAHTLPLDATAVNVDLHLDYRRKGLMWYSTYRVGFAGEYRVVNTTRARRKITFKFPLPTQNGVYDDFHVLVGGKPAGALNLASGGVAPTLTLEPGQSQTVSVSYGSQGMDDWWYDLGSDVKQLRNFRLTMVTDFEAINFPDESISPTEKERAGKGWRLTWQYDNLLSGINIGMVMPSKLNPGPWASRVSYFAPVSLLFFFFILLLVTTVRRIPLHPMVYFFMGAAFFSFHLLLSYLVDHVALVPAFAIASAVSVFLVVSYMRLVAGWKFALLVVGGAQLVYLVLFSSLFFLEGFTGLGVTILSILTLFVVMQGTAMVDWDHLFRKSDPTHRIAD